MQKHNLKSNMITSSMIRKRWIFIVIILGTVLTFCLTGGCSAYKSLGDNPDGEALSKIEKLGNYRNNEFQNLDSSGVDFSKVSMTQLMKTMYNKPANARPSKAIPFVKTNLENNYDTPTIIWFGHSSFLIKTRNINILVDPDLSGYAGPNSWFVKAYEGSDFYKLKDMPRIDILLISHDHYDHLDYETAKGLKNKVKHIIVPMGIGSHLQYWGYKPSQIHELNWYESFAVSPDMNITVAPARHESGRTLSGKKTLWGSFVISVDGYKLFYSGDSAYGRHFKEIGKTYGPFDLAMMECGQYNKLWSRNHMFPEQTALAASELRAKVILPVHWGKFTEAVHPWNESVNRLLPAAGALKIPVTIPKIGEPYSIGSPVLKDEWYN
jgi:L-ascorbate metabolism protein UlaG (beta-lactamase superfamily)